MVEFNHEAFGRDWDCGEGVIEGLLSIPLKHIIKNLAEKDGIDIHNPRRKGAAISTSIFSAFMGHVLGPVPALLLGLMGNLASYSGKCIGDRWDSEEGRLINMKIESLFISRNALYEHVSEKTWNRICDSWINIEVKLKKEGIEKVDNNKEAFEIIFPVFQDMIKSVDYDVYDNFMKVYYKTLEVYDK